MTELALVLLLGALSVVVSIVIGERCHVWWMTESGVAILVGMAVGLAWFVYSVAISTDEVDTTELEMFEFNPATFTLLLLPPIIFESGFNLNHRFFFSNIGVILTFAFLGTLVTFGVIAPSLYFGLGGAHGLFTPLEACAFGALISAVDPVATLAIFSRSGADPKLNALIFGESVLNDAVAIVLFKTVVQLGTSEPLTAESVGTHLPAAIGSFILIFGGSVLVGVFGGALIALLFKLVNLRSLPPSAAAPAELIVLICLSYSTFLAAEHARLSGIVASLFSGAVCVVYVKRNLSEQGAALCDTTVHVLARFAETIVFVLIGYGFALYGIGPLANSATSPGGNASSAPGHLLPVLPSSASSHNASSSPGEAVCTPVEPGGQKMEPAFILLTLALCLLSRVCSVFPMAALANTWRSPMHKIKLHEQVVIWFSGLRGAIALALAVEFPTAHEVRGTAGEGNFCYQREHVVACTIVVVLCTVFLMGGFTKPVLKLCGIAMSVENPPESPALKPQQTSKHGWKRQLLRFDRKVIRPVLITGYEGDQQ